MLLTPRSVTFVIGNSFKDLNIGKLKKHGIDIELNFNRNPTPNISYFLKGIFGFNENRVVFEDDPVYAPEYSKLQGKPLGAQMNGALLTGTGYYTSINDIHNNAAPCSIDQINVGDYKFLDYKVDGAITMLDLYPIKGNLYPPIVYSFSGGIMYKGLDFHFLFQGNQGKYVEYNLIYEYEFVKGNWRVHQSQLDYWRPDNQDVNHSTLHYTTGSGTAELQWGGGEGNNSGYNIKIPGRLWRNSSYLRLRDLYLGYTVNKNILNRLPIPVSDVVIYAVGNNVLTITPLIEGDPEPTNYNYGYYPPMKSWTFGLRFSF